MSPEEKALIDINERLEKLELENASLTQNVNLLNPLIPGVNILQGPGGDFSEIGGSSGPFEILTGSFGVSFLAETTDGTTLFRNGVNTSTPLVIPHTLGVKPDYVDVRLSIGSLFDTHVSHGSRLNGNLIGGGLDGMVFSEDAIAISTFDIQVEPDEVSLTVNRAFWLNEPNSTVHSQSGGPWDIQIIVGLIA